MEPKRPSAPDTAQVRPLYCAGFARRLYPAVLRRAARYYLTDHKLDAEVIDASVIVLSELLTNAIQHTRRPHTAWVSVRIQIDAEFVWIEVTDPSNQAPLRRRPGNHAQHGRGLVIVGELAAWGYQRLTGGGKRVTARVSRASGSPDASV
jgi:anti-sigma regulatory factor (Ser/Thr protein kinase)